MRKKRRFHPTEVLISLAFTVTLAIASADLDGSKSHLVDIIEPQSATNGSLTGVPRLVDVTTSDGRRLISYQLPKQSLVRPTTGSVTAYLQISIPSFSGVNGGWGADKGGLGTFYGLEMRTFSKVEPLDTIQYKIGGGAPTPSTPATDWKPVAFDSIINVPLRQGTIYFKIKLTASSSTPQPLTVSARFKSARLCTATGAPVTGIDPYSDLWLLSHGKIDGENSFRTMNEAVKKAAGTARVFTLDWASGADGELTDLTNGRYFINLGKNLAQLLKDRGRTSTNVEWVGHSWGTYIGYETARAFGQVNRMIALDPAITAQGGYDDTRIKFAAVSMVSTGVRGGDASAFAGSDPKCQTCDFRVRLLSDNTVPAGIEYITFYHSLPRSWFIRALTYTGNPYWNYFRPVLLRAELKPTMPPGWGSYLKLNGFDLECHGQTNSDNGASDFLNHDSLLYNHGGIITEARAAKNTDGSVVWKYTPR
jgi:pimeloyl-ACP methyl ester carboxylesterase